MRYKALIETLALTSTHAPDSFPPLFQMANGNPFQSK